MYIPVHIAAFCRAVLKYQPLERQSYEAPLKLHGMPPV
jgi:hypothetical protein